MPETPPRRLSAVERDAQARAELAPLAADERPPALWAAIAVSLLVGLGVLAGALTVHDLKAHGGSLPAAIFLAAVMFILARGMYAKRYWAVLGFEALLAFQVLATSLALVVSATLIAAALCVTMVLLGGWLFYKLIRVMGRIQTTEALARGQSAGRSGDR